MVVDTRLGADVFSLGESLSVDATELAAMQPVDPEQLFQELPGFSVSRPGGAGGVSEIFLRGAESNFTAVYIDGVRLNNSSNTRGGSFDFSLLDIYGIQRVDVASGAMSAVYGADAMAGIISIRTAWAEPGTANLMLEAGSTGDWQMGAATSLALGRELDWSLRASSLDGGDEIEGSSLRVDSLGTRLAGSWNSGNPWEVSLRYVQRDRTSFPEVSGGPEYAVLRDLETGEGDELSIAGSTSWEMADNWSSELYFSGARINDDTSVPAVAPGVLDAQPAFTTVTEYERAQVLWVNRVMLRPDLHLVAGLDAVKESGSDEGVVDLGFAVLPNAYELDRNLSSAFAELGKQWSNGLVTTLALRWDDGGGERRASGKFGVEREISASGSRIWARIANGFKLPSFFALGNPLYGNPDLVAEEVRNAELGYTHVFDNGSELILSAYKSRFEELVDFDFENFTNVNLGRIEVSGIEVRTRFELTPSLQVQADGNWSTFDSSSGELRRRPEQTGGVALDWGPMQNWHLNLSLRYVGSRLITSIPTGDVQADDFTLLGATGSYSFSPNQRVWLAVDNALDEDYQDAPGFPSPGARVRIGTKLRF